MNKNYNIKKNERVTKNIRKKRKKEIKKNPIPE